MEEVGDVVIIPLELFERIRLRIGIMSDTCARDIGLDLDKCLGASEKKVMNLEEIQAPKEKQIRFVDPFTFEIDEG